MPETLIFKWKPVEMPGRQTSEGLGLRVAEIQGGFLVLNRLERERGPHGLEDQKLPPLIFVPNRRQVEPC